jgi:hypothetical protein
VAARRKRTAGALEREIAKLSPQETRDLLLLTMYKLALARAQLDALTDLLVKKKMLTREEVWKLTAKRFEEHGF